MVAWIGVVAVAIVFLYYMDFSPNGHNPDGPFALTINILGSGTVTVYPSNETYAHGTIVTLTAFTTDPSWWFDQWFGDLEGFVNPETIFMDADKTVTAQFINGEDEKFRIWVVSDMQIDYAAPLSTTDWQDAVLDMNGLDPDIVCVNGDLVQNGWKAGSERDDYYIGKALSSCTSWYEIAGNHEFWSGGSWTASSTFTHTVGNLLLIFIGDRNSACTHSDSDFGWLHSQIVNNQDKNIFVISHPPVYDCGTPRSTQDPHAGMYYYMKFTDTNCVGALLQTVHVEAWFAGHIHTANGEIVQRSANSINPKWGTVHCATAGITTDRSAGDSMSILVELEEGSRTVVLKVRNHLTHTWFKEYAFELAYEFRSGS